MRLAAQRENVAADVGIGFRDCIFELLKGDVVVRHLLRINQHLVLLHRTAESRDVDHARHGLELPFQHPILHRLQLIECVFRSFEDIADDLARGLQGESVGVTPWGNVVIIASRLITSWRAFQ